MSNFMFTDAGNRWIAKALVGEFRSPNTMYMIYTDKGGTLDINTVATSDGIDSNPNKIKTNQVALYVDSNNPTATMISGAVTCDNSQAGKYIAGVAVCCGTDTLVVASLDKPVQCIANTSIMVTVPLRIGTSGGNE